MDTTDTFKHLLHSGFTLPKGPIPARHRDRSKRSQLRPSSVYSVETCSLQDSVLLVIGGKDIFLKSLKRQPWKRCLTSIGNNHIARQEDPLNIKGSSLYPSKACSKWTHKRQPVTLRQNLFAPRNKQICYPIFTKSATFISHPRMPRSIEREIFEE